MHSKCLTVGAILLTLVGCDRFPMSIENRTGSLIKVSYSTRSEACDLKGRKFIELKPGRKFAIMCEPDELLEVQFSTEENRSCDLKTADIQRIIQKEEGFSGSFLLPLQPC